MRLAAFAAAFVLSATAASAAWAPPAAADPIQVEARGLPLNPADQNDRRLGPLAYLDGVELTSGDPRFGGWSDLVIEGDRLLAVGDEGSLLAATLAFDGEGRLTGLADAELTPLLNEQGKPFPDKSWQDAEAMAELNDGSLVVGFERHHRVLRYASPTGPAEAFPTPAVISQAAGPNQGLEALVAWPDGRLIGLLEGSEEFDATMGVIWQGEVSATFAYPLDNGFQVTGAAFLPHPEGGDGDLLVLERFYTPAEGVKARLRLVPGNSLQPDAMVQPETWGTLIPPQTVDNMEGIAVVRDAAGRTLVYLLSDDNFNKGQQRTLLLRFELTYE